MARMRTYTASRQVRRGETLPGTAVLAAALVFLLAAAGPAAAQLDPADLADTAAFLSRQAFNGEPTLVTTADAEAAALVDLDAVPLGEDLYTSAKLDGLIFRVYRADDLLALLPVVCEDHQVHDDPCPDIETITYRDRACFKEQGVSTPEPCSLQADGTYRKWWTSAKNRCRLAIPGEFCTEIRVVGWHLQHYSDPCCELEIPGTHEEVTGLRCQDCD